MLANQILRLCAGAAVVAVAASLMAAATPPEGGEIDLFVLKEDHTPTVEPGELYFYQLIYTNNGSVTATGVRLIETVPVGTAFSAASSTPGWSCPDGSPAGTVCELAVGSVAPGAGGLGAFFYLQAATAMPAGLTEIVNTATIEDDGTNGSDANPADNTTTHVSPLDVSGIAPDLVVIKDDGGQMIAPGDVAVYTLGYANIGTRGATGVELSETVPALSTFDAAASSGGWSCSGGAPAGTPCLFSVGTLQPGESAAVTFAAKSDSPVPPGATGLTNTAQITDDGANGVELDPSNNSSTDTTPFGGPGAGPDLTVAKDDGGIEGTAGSVIVYQLDYANLGPRGATGVVLEDTVPGRTTFEAAASTAGWSCSDGAPPGTVCEWTVGTLLAGDSGAVDFAVRVVDPLPSTESIVNTAQVADDGTNGDDVDPSSNTASDFTPLEGEPGAADLVATAVDTVLPAPPATPAATISYTVVVTSSGDVTAEGATFSAPAPTDTALQNGTVTTTQGTIVAGNSPGDTAVAVALGDLDPGNEAVVTLEVEIDPGLAPSVTEIAFQGAVAAAGLLARPTDDPDTVEPDDPTRTPVVHGVPSPLEIPTLSWPLMVALGLGLCGAAWHRLRAVRA